MSHYKKCIIHGMSCTCSSDFPCVYFAKAHKSQLLREPKTSENKQFKLGYITGTIIKHLDELQDILPRKTAEIQQIKSALIKALSGEIL